MRKDDLKKKIISQIDVFPHKEAIKRLALFGSQLHGTATERSDVDILVEFQPGARVGFFKMSHMLRFLEQNTGKKVDLVPKDGLSKYFRDEVLSESETIYERK
ncbi:MAG: nucleotidyltransferase domain-containing protein [Candidatus Moranbacteria bacterium]|nr:nucleotidyltransferase domain-containing protein [Candidatus Moranbacteria bacterium]